MRAKAALDLLRELRLRPKGELAARLAAAASAKLGLTERRFPAVAPDPQHLVDALRPGIATTLAEFVAHFDGRDALGFLFDEADAARALALYPPPGPSDLPAAEDAVAGRFSFCGSPVVDFAGTVDWHHALHTDGRWPRTHWTRIPFKALGRLGDIKACWEMNRHQSFVALGLAWRRTGDDRYVDAFVRHLASWCDQNPPETGIHSISNLELGLRCIAWQLAHRLMSPSPRYTAEARGLLHLHTYFMARHLAGNLAYTARTGRNNHLIGDAASLAALALTYPEWRDAAVWERRALDHLCGALDEQILPDGMHFELSFAYHLFVLEFVWLVVLLLERHGRSAPTAALGHLERMSDAIARALQPDGLPPNLNDNDDGVVFALHGSERERIAALLALAAARFGRCDLKALAPPAPAAGWLLGVRGLDALDAVSPAAPDPGPTALPSAGLYILRSGRDASADYALIDHHPDPFPRSGHNHASLLQLLVQAGGRPALVDSGTSRYGADGGYRNALRGTAAHSTLRIDGQDQAKPVRNFGWAALNPPGRASWQSGPDFALFDGEHNAYRRLPAPCTHRRTVLWLRDARLWLIRDAVEGPAADHCFERFWHFAPDLAVSGDGSSFVALGAEGLRATLYLPSTGPAAEPDRVRGDPARKWSFISPRYGVVEPKAVLVERWRGPPPQARLALLIAGSTPVPTVHQDADGRRTMIAIDGLGVLEIGPGTATLRRE